jgi:hypothetical protein
MPAQNASASERAKREGVRRDGARGQEVARESGRATRGGIEASRLTERKRRQRASARGMASAASERSEREREPEERALASDSGEHVGYERAQRASYCERAKRARGML